MVKKYLVRKKMAIVKKQFPKEQKHMLIQCFIELSIEFKKEYGQNSIIQFCY